MTGKRGIYARFYFWNTEDNNFFNVIFRYVQIQPELENIPVDHSFKFRPKSFISADCRDNSGILSACFLAFAIITSRQYSEIDATVSMVLLKGTLVHVKLLLLSFQLFVSVICVWTADTH